jgi:uncharacterized cupin superfamily protein
MCAMAKARNVKQISSANATADRPPFIVRGSDVPEIVGSYPNSSEQLSAGRAIGRAAGLLRIGLHIERLPSGTRTSWPHAESLEEEFAFVLDGEVDCWIDGTVHRMTAGDLAAFPAGTGISHTFINNSDREAILLVGGEANKSDNRIVYPLAPQRAKQLPWSRWWHDAPLRLRGPHDGLPDARNASARTATGPKSLKTRAAAKARPKITVVVKARKTKAATPKVKKVRP